MYARLRAGTVPLGATSVGATTELSHSPIEAGAIAGRRRRAADGDAELPSRELSGDPGLGNLQLARGAPGGLGSGSGLGSGLG